MAGIVALPSAARPRVGAAQQPYADSPALSRSKGNPWRPVGTWQTAPGAFEGEITRAGGLDVWLGLRNSDDQGTAVDLRAELSIGGVVVAAGEVRCVGGLTRDPGRATPVRVAFEPSSARAIRGADLALGISVRIAAGACAGHASATGVRLYYGSAARAARFDAVTGP